MENQRILGKRNYPFGFQGRSKTPEGTGIGQENGSSYSDIFDEYGPDAIMQQPKGGESLEDFNKRVSEIIDKLVEKNKGNRIIVVTTPDVIQTAVAKTLNLTPANQYKVLIKTGTLTQISYFENGWSSIIYSDYSPI